jgi:isopentenyl diphosphate isomerase/L-lactate dehydrogenase-like FMN-dependent dehydrogenase
MVPSVLKTWATVVADIDLRAAGGSSCAMIVCGTAGNLTLTPHGAPAADVLVYFAAGVPQYLAANAIKLAGATATKVTVGWS